MSASSLPVAAIIHSAGQDGSQVLAAFVRELIDGGVRVRGVVQRNTPDPRGGHFHMALIDVKDGTVYPISQALGPGSSSCCLDVGGLAEASQVLRKAIDGRPALIVTNRFGEQEASGRGFAAEMLAVMAEGIPLLTVVQDAYKSAWEAFTGGSVVLPPSLDALRQWYAGIAARPPC